MMPHPSHCDKGTTNPSSSTQTLTVLKDGWQGFSQSIYFVMPFLYSGEVVADFDALNLIKKWILDTVRMLDPKNVM